MSGFAILLQRRESLGMVMGKTACPQAAKSLVLILKGKGLGKKKRLTKCKRGVNAQLPWLPVCVRRLHTGSWSSLSKGSLVQGSGSPTSLLGLVVVRSLMPLLF